MKKNLSLEKIKEERKKSRIDKISSLIKRTIAEVLLTFDFNDHNVKNVFIFVSHVVLSSDGKSATVFLETLDNLEISYDNILETITKDSSRIKKEFSSRIDLRYTPRLKFELINSKDYKNSNDK